MDHHPYNLPHNEQNLQQQQQLAVQPQQQTVIVGGMKRPFSEQRNNLENSDNIQLASKRFHPMERKENWRNGGEEEEEERERVEQSSADDEEPFIMSAYSQPLSYYQLIDNNNGATSTVCADAFHANIGQLLPFDRAAQQNANGKEKPIENGDDINSAANDARHQNTPNVQILSPILPYTHSHHHLNHLFHNCSPFEPFCTVPGRMSLLSSITKYRVSIGEIQRRISPPECLNTSLIGGILRKAKSKDGGKALRESLKRVGLSLPAGRRKSACVTAFTALVEEEAIHMANDFNAVLQHDFPSKDIGFFFNAQFLRFTGQSSMDAELVAKRRTILNCSRIFVKEITNLLAADRSPICDRRPELVLDPCMQKKLHHFSMITHGFGGIAMLSLLESLAICLDESLKNLDKMVETINQLF